MKNKPCPFCGISDLEMFVVCGNNITDEHWVKCNRCYANGPVGNTPSEAWDVWNKRLVYYKGFR